MTDGIAQSLTKFEKWQSPSYFRGYNIEQNGWSWLRDDFLNAQDFLDLKATGANLVSLSIEGTVQDSFPYSPNFLPVIDPSDTIFIQAILDSLVQWCKDADLNYIISPRSGPGFRDEADGVPRNRAIWTNSLDQGAYGKMLKQIVSQHLNDPLFVGLVLMNEPHPFESYGQPLSVIQDSLDITGIDPSDIFSRMIDSIRTVDMDLPIIVEPINWSLPPYAYFQEKLLDQKVVYDIHFYHPNLYCLYGDSLGDMNTRDYPGYYWENILFQDEVFFDKALLDTAMAEHVIAFQEQWDVPIYMGEFGLFLPQRGGETYLRDLYRIAIQHSWHFSLWSWRGSYTMNYEKFDSLSPGSRYWNTVLSFFSENTHVAVPIDGLQVPSALMMDQNYPNPFNPVTTIRFHLEEPSLVTLSVYNIRGQLVETLIHENKSAGQHSVVWDANGLASGLYFYRIRAGENTSIKKCIVVN